MRLQKPRLEQLLGQLSQKRGMGGKIRILAGAWPLLQQLSSSERERVGLVLGSRWAQQHLDRFVAARDLSPNERRLRQLLSRIEDADPKELREMAGKLRRGEIEELGQRFAAGLLETLEGQAESAEERLARDPTSVPPVLKRQPGAPDKNGGGPEVAQRKPTSAPAPQGPEGLESEAPAGHEPSFLAPAIEPTALATELEADAVEVLETVEPVQPAEPIEPNLEPSLKTPGVHTAPATAIQALRLLRTLRPGAAAMPNSPQDRATLIRRLGDGWAARRGILAMIRSGAFEQIEEALELIATLENPAAEFWCLAELLETSDLTETDIQRLLAACPGTAGRRRLERRVRRRALSA